MIAIMKKYLFPAIAVLILLPTIIGSVYVSTSLWFFKGLLPKLNYHTVIGVQDMNGDTQNILKVVHEQLTQHEEENMQNIMSRYVHAKTDTSQYIAGFPRLQQRRNVKETLEQDGWNVRRVLWATYGEKHTDVVESSGRITQSSTSLFAEGWSEFFKYSIEKRLPANPLMFVVIRPRATKFIDSGVVGMASEHDSGVKVQLRFGDDVKLEDISKSTLKNNKETNNNRMSFTAPSNVLNKVPKTVIEGLEGRIHEMMGFEKTQPPFLSDLVTQKNVGVVGRDDDIAIGASGDINSFITSAETWLRKEESRRNPIKHAFALPDGGLGYAYIPGESSVILDGVKRKEGCHSVNAYERIFWLCVGENNASLSTKENMAMEFIEQKQVEDHWMFKIQGDAFRNIPKIRESIGGIQYMTAVGTIREAEIYIQ